jgi:hypothetical protein
LADNVNSQINFAADLWYKPSVPILTAEASSETFPCPSCGEFIAGNSVQCRYCAVTIPPFYAHNAVLAQNKINQACDEAGWLRAFTGVMWVFFFVRFIPFVGFIGAGGMVMTFFSAPVWIIYWGARFGSLKTKDVDYASARRNWIISLFLWLLMLAVLFFRVVAPLAVDTFFS